MVEPLTTMMSSLPSLSQSIRPTPPLMDSTMYCLSGVEMCGTVRPTSRETSLKPGAWAQTVGEKIRTIKRIVRITVRVFDYRGQRHSPPGYSGTEKSETEERDYVLRASPCLCASVVNSCSDLSWNLYSHETNVE